ncbi:MAG: hypothetical protein ACJ8AO_00515, partial [Gemmatimonadaceae bacterium]
MLHPPRPANRPASLDAPVPPDDAAPTATPLAPLPSFWWMRAPFGLALALALPLAVAAVARSLSSEIA